MSGKKQQSHQDLLEKEKAAIGEMSDTTEAALASAVLRAKVDAFKGVTTAGKSLVDAEKALAEYRLNRGDTAGDWFKSIAEAERFLNDQGFDVSHGKFFADVKSGKVETQGKRLSKFSTLLYAMQQRLSSRVGGIDLDLTKRREEADTLKAEHSAEIERMKAENMRRRMSTEWCHREEVHGVWASIMGDLYTALIHNAGSSTGKIITACNGNQNKSVNVNNCLSGIIDNSFNEVGMRGRVEAVFYIEGDDEPADADDN